MLNPMRRRPTVQRSRAPPLDPGDQLGYRGTVEEIARRKLEAECLARSQHQAHRQQRVSPEVEEVVVHSDRFDVENFGPEPGQHRLRAAGQPVWRIGSRDVCPAPGAEHLGAFGGRQPGQMRQTHRRVLDDGRQQAEELPDLAANRRRVEQVGAVVDLPDQPASLFFQLQQQIELRGAGGGVELADGPA